MTVEWHGEEMEADLKRRIGQALARCAVLFQTWHKQQLNKSNPAPYADSSKPGEYPRARTGFGRDATTYDPQSPAQMAEQGFVLMGYLVNAWYMGYLETMKGRLGLKKTLEDLQPKLKAILDAAGRE